MLYESPDMSSTQGFRIFDVKMKKGLQKSQIYFLVTPESVGQYAPEWVGQFDTGWFDTQMAKTIG